MLGAAPGTASSGNGGTWTQVTSADQFTTGQYYMVTNTGYAPGVIDASESNRWISAVPEADAPEQAIWTLTVDDSTVTLKDSNNRFVAPKGGETNGIIEAEYSWTWAFANGMFTFSGQGDDIVGLASNKGSQNKFRAYKLTTIEGQSYPWEFTLYKLEGGSSTPTVAAPQASPQAGSVTSGTQVTLSCTTGGATIYYTLNGDEPTTSSTQYTGPISLAAYEVGTEVTLKAIAVKDGVTSAVQTISYTIRAESEPPIKGGDQVVIYAPAYNKALSSEKTSFYNVGTDVSFDSNGVMSGYDANDIWTVVANTEDGTYSFQQNGQNIGLADQYNSMNLGAVNDRWKLIDLGNGLYNIQNAGRGNYMEWYNSENNWSTYNSNSAATDGQFQLAFYKVTGDIPDPSEPEVPIKAGDKVGIYLPSEQLVITTTANSYG